MRDAQGLTAEGRVDGRRATITVGVDGIDLAGRTLPWTSVDALHRGTHELVLVTDTGAQVTLHHLGRQFQRVADAVTAARDAARRRALLQHADAAPLLQVRCRREAVRATLCLFHDRLTVEPVEGPAAIAPFGLLAGVERDGWTITLRRRGLPPLVVSHLGAATDELLDRLDGARAAAARQARERRAALDPALVDLDLPDGWAVDAATAGLAWAALRGAVGRMARAAELATLEALAEGAGGALRLGLKALPGSGVLPFALATVADRTAVEAVDADDRATLVFDTGDADRLNAVLLLTSFRREALILADDRLGRWALAVRLLPEVRWARAALVARVVHDDRWEDRVRAALAR